MKVSLLRIERVVQVTPFTYTGLAKHFGVTANEIDNLLRKSAKGREVRDVLRRTVKKFLDDGFKFCTSCMGVKATIHFAKASSIKCLSCRERRKMTYSALKKLVSKTPFTYSALAKHFNLAPITVRNFFRTPKGKKLREMLRATIKEHLDNGFRMCVTCMKVKHNDEYDGVTHNHCSPCLKVHAKRHSATFKRKAKAQKKLEMKLCQLSTCNNEFRTNKSKKYCSLECSAEYRKLYQIDRLRMIKENTWVRSTFKPLSQEDGHLIVMETIKRTEADTVALETAAKREESFVEKQVASYIEELEKRGVTVEQIVDYGGMELNELEPDIFHMILIKLTEKK